MVVVAAWKTRFKGTGRGTQEGGGTCRLGRRACTLPAHTSDCRECCRANSSLQFDLKEFQGECYSALTSVSTKRSTETAQRHTK